MEIERLELQATLDGQKTSADRNKMGQFATPTALAREVLRYGIGLLDGETIRFVDPAVGTGSFYSALLATATTEQIEKAVGFEIDPHYGEPAAELWDDADIEYRMGDFTAQAPDPSFNLLICNPPYVRHHHIANEDKARLQLASAGTIGRKLSGLAGLYVYFMALAHGWMKEGGVAGWLIPSEFMDVNYGREIKRYLLEDVSLLRIHRYDPNDVQFDDALVSSAVVWIRKQKPDRDHEVEFSFGGTLEQPALVKSVAVRDLAKESKWTRFPSQEVRSGKREPVVSDFFQIKRGIATGDNKFFILTEDQIAEHDLPMEAFRPILPSPRYLKVDEIRSDDTGVPLIDKRLFLLDTRESEETIATSSPSLHRYLEEGRLARLHEGYLCSRRSPWYVQEKREPPPIVCTYLGRSDKKSGRPFRFILNDSNATIANVYLGMYPKAPLLAAMERDPTAIRRAWQALNAISPEQLLGEGRVYGGGLHKLEPKELANVPVPELADLLDVTQEQGELLEAAE